MPSRFRRVLGLVVLLLFVATAPRAHASPFTNVFFFGDSLSDTGNLHLATGGAQPGAGAYLGGRFSDGPLWTEYLAAGLGFASASASYLLGGNNYAFAGARTGSATTPPGLLAQAAGIWGPTHASADPDALYVVAGGSNDLRDARNLYRGSTAADDAGRQLEATKAIGGLGQTLGYLAAKGARHVLLTNAPDLGLTPEAAFLGLQAASSDASARFNALMPSLLALGAGFGLDIAFLDMAALNRAIVDDAMNGGALFGIMNATSPCAGFAGGSVTNPCATSLFSDALHPSGRAHELLGQAALDAVPEPAIVFLVTVGLAAAIRRRRV